MAESGYPERMGSPLPYTAIQHDECDFCRSVVDRLPILSGSTYRDFWHPDVFAATTLERTRAPNGVWIMRTQKAGATYRDGKFDSGAPPPPRYPMPINHL